MVAVADVVTTARDVRVALRGGDEASGLARIVGQYLEQLLNDTPEKREQALALRGRLGLHAHEGDVAITIVFGGDGLAIEEGLREPDAVIRGEIEALMHMLAGRRNPALEIAGGGLSFRPRVQRPLFGYQAYQVMRLPGVHVWSGLLRRALLYATGAAAVAVALLLVARSRAQGSGDV